MQLFPRGTVLASLLTLLCVGCGGSDGPAPSTDPQATISGTVTYDGKPIPLDSAVVFHCTEKGVTASGKVDSLGKYSLTGSIEHLGIPAGRYQVTVQPPQVKLPVMGEPGYEDVMMGKIPAAPVVKEIPAKFHKMESSGLVFEVKEGENTFDLDLKKLE
ncbi:MAG: carboxypeptidase-like regulatory domain-containing protein [Planctomycetaceae bacterium]